MLSKGQPCARHAWAVLILTTILLGNFYPLLHRWNRWLERVRNLLKVKQLIIGCSSLVVEKECHGSSQELTSTYMLRNVGRPHTGPPAVMHTICVCVCTRGEGGGYCHLKSHQNTMPWRWNGCLKKGIWGDVLKRGKAGKQGRRRQNWG